jgi:hypothetical protein
MKNSKKQWESIVALLIIPVLIATCVVPMIRNLLSISCLINITDNRGFNAGIIQFATLVLAIFIAFIMEFSFAKYLNCKKKNRIPKDGQQAY